MANSVLTLEIACDEILSLSNSTFLVFTLVAAFALVTYVAAEYLLDTTDVFAAFIGDFHQ